MKDMWARMNPAAASLLRAVGLGVAGAVITFLYSFFQTYETPAEAGVTFGLVILVLRSGVEGLYDWWRTKTGKAADYPVGD